jgi:hypothetical protein
MTMHHTVELDRPVPLDAWARARLWVVEDDPELGSRIVTDLRTRYAARSLAASPRAPRGRFELEDALAADTQLAASANVPW